MTASCPIGSSNGLTRTSAPAARARSRRAVEVGQEISRAFEAEGVRDRGLESEHRYRAERSQNQWPHGAARGRCPCEDALLRRCSTASRNQARDEPVEFFG